MKPYNRENSTKGEEVREMFNSIAPAYDRLNHILSMQIDKVWRSRVVSIVSRHCTSLDYAPKILDLATGTADLAIAMARRISHSEVVGVDPSEGMLQVGSEKIAALNLGDRVVLTINNRPRVYRSKMSRSML